MVCSGCSASRVTVKRSAFANRGRTIKAVGVQEMFEKHRPRQPDGLNRGLNRLARNGGLMYAPPLR